MAPANPVDHQRSAWQRCMLLACDSRQSVMTEVLAGDTNCLAFTPYGHMHSPNAVMTRMGFNGELREQRTGWYFLGNGYRAYNPRLMRFHSSDSWSPFGRGGLNSYMYCGGDPMMNVDPTGHVFWRKVATFIDFFSLSNNSTGPINNSLPAAPGSVSSTVMGLVGTITETPAGPPWRYGGVSGSARRKKPGWPRSDPGTSKNGNSQSLRRNSITTSQADAGSESGRELSRTNSSIRFRSNSTSSSNTSDTSSVSSPSTYSTISSLSLSSGDSGIDSNHSRASSGGSVGGDIQLRLENLRR